MSYLENIQDPGDLRKLTIRQLTKLAGEIRARIIEVVGKNGGHLASNLGVTELTLALHYCFDFATDRLLWDVGHQCYPHKLLTGRHDRFDQLRKAGGLSGFPNTSESPYDLFDVGHAGTAIATALGLARGDEALGNHSRVVALVGDASIVNGVAFEGLNQAGLLKRQFLVILNDNKWGIAPTRGTFADVLAKMRTSVVYEDFKHAVGSAIRHVPLVGQSVFETLDHLKEGLKATVSPHQIFEQMGYKYVGPVDGHDLGHLIELFSFLKDVNQPVLLHAHTEKGRGCDWALADPGRYHSPKPFRVENDKVVIQTGSGKSWTTAFAESLIDLARQDDRIFALTAAMPDGTGLSQFEQVFPERYLDVGIAESCTVDMAAGMARAGLRPVVAIYSTFLQRAFDQVFQEVVLQGLPVMFCLDRAGLVGGDGAVHHGFLDITYLRGFPGMVVMAPADEPELRLAMKLGLSLNGPCAIRYPRADVPEVLGPTPPFVPGKSRVMREGSSLTLLAYGACVPEALDAADILSEESIDACVVNARFAKPIDDDMVRRALSAGGPVLTIEDHSVAGGFGSAVLESAGRQRLAGEPIRCLGMPADRFIAYGSRASQLAEVGIDAAGIAAAAQQALIELESEGHGLAHQTELPDSDELMAER